jgi:antitoxin (DNA-binding transcriptional repressor) of toxin-antitoxin stability system
MTELHRRTAEVVQLVGSGQPLTVIDGRSLQPLARLVPAEPVPLFASTA